MANSTNRPTLTAAQQLRVLLITTRNDRRRMLAGLAPTDTRVLMSCAGIHTTEKQS